MSALIHSMRCIIAEESGPSAIVLTRLNVLGNSAINNIVFLGSNPLAHQPKGTLSIKQHDLVLVIKISLSLQSALMCGKNMATIQD